MKAIALSLCCLLAACQGCEVETLGEQLSQYPSSPFEQHNGELWFPTAFDGVYRYDGATFERFTTANGLAGDTVRCIVEDGDGVLWFATDGGLCSYDGARFTTWTDYEGATSPVGFAEHGHHRDLWHVFVDREGGMWICTLDGVWRFDGERFTRFELRALAAEHEYEFTPNMVYAMCDLGDGALWFATDGAGAVRVDGDRQQAFTTRDGLCSDHVCTIVRDGRGDMWFGTSNGGVSRYDGKTFTTHLRNETWSEHNGWGRFLGVCVDARGDVWFGRSSPGGGAWRYDGERFELFDDDDGLGSGGVISVSTDRRGRVWFGTTGGVFVYDGETFENVRKRASG